ncbi:hypothetical protein CTEN210_05610 [Chaetoceros tenuissimus]|uniref:EF-hand domain-containing protein n=1 Tax=Chaetoceros tenuissimus TaxID=426638 RepID=A0AAD3CNW4_9STRA|nr:hypothetical protein CTEN210_05610 [Chaetoceros tenuissimus]
MAFSTAITTATSTSTIAFCQGKKGEDEEDAISKIKAIISSNIDVEAIGKNLGEKVNEAIATGVPTEISYGFVCGFSSGFALKKVGKVASIMFGLGFATLQTLSYAGYIDVDHSQLQKDVEKMMDLNSDGKIDAKDGEKVMDKVMEVLQFGMVGGGGFAAGFIGGFRSG